jgi:DNA-binding CsgD family transcriptional regulator
MALRVAEEIPMRMVVCNRTVAMLPLSVREGNRKLDTLVIHGTAIVDALAILFDSCWSTARPVQLSARDGAALSISSAGLPSAGDRQILLLMVLGLADRKIAADLGISLRTVERRIRALMELAGVKSRFQLGWHAAGAGWLPDRA